jgi:pSer/pThr/pTyr-binding forkhead associated (FHA) protein
LSHVYCGECGFQNPEASNYCSRCGARLEKGESGEQTMTFTPEEVNDDPGAALQDIGGKGPALVVRAGGGRAGESFFPSDERTLIGRSPECDVFLDDVTVSRKHAEFVRHRTAFEVRDLNSLNGTYFDGVRIDTALLSDGAEVQIGKYRLTFYASRRDLSAAGAG